MHILLNTGHFLPSRHKKYCFIQFEFLLNFGHWMLDAVSEKACYIPEVTWN